MLEMFRYRMQSMGKYDGEVRKNISRKIMDATWNQDGNTENVYVKWVNCGLPKVCEAKDILLKAKYNEKSYHNITGDEIAYLMQFRIEDMKKYDFIKVGAYVQRWNELGEPEWWLIVHCDDRASFRQFSILKCNWIYKWVSEKDGNRIIHECLGAPRKQSSYNSGVWQDYRTKTVENQEVIWLPTNEETKTIGYTTCFLKSEPGRYPPLKWNVSKIEDTAVRGISRITMTQEQFDANKDNEELMIANYYNSLVRHDNECNIESDNFKISYFGAPTIKAGGGYKKFLLKEYRDGNYIDYTGDVVWEIKTEGFDKVFDTIIEKNILKIKCKPDYEMIGKVFSVIATISGQRISLVVEVVGL